MLQTFCLKHFIFLPIIADVAQATVDKWQDVLD